MDSPAWRGIAHQHAELLRSLLADRPGTRQAWADRLGISRQALDAHQPAAPVASAREPVHGPAGALPSSHGAAAVRVQVAPGGLRGRRDPRWRLPVDARRDGWALVEPRRAERTYTRGLVAVIEPGRDRNVCRVRLMASGSLWSSGYAGSLAYAIRVADALVADAVRSVS